MSSESDGEMEACFSSMRQPPLIKQLKGILSEYPDGGQILKELLQNAEDAGASEVHIICETRDINQDDEQGKAKEYRKFFQGPAMCVYNNAMFTDKDWEGVQMIYSSVKEDDRFKVGRFGLGFKSVFHITDYPCILSGDKLLLIDPQQPSDKVNAQMYIKKLNKYKRMDVEAFLLALQGMFQIDRDIIGRGTFNGTLFWFPLRRTESVLSSNIYNEARVRELFDMFECEAQTILLFLRNLTSITLSVRNVSGSLEEIVSVKLANGEDVKKKRSDFNETILDLPKNYRGQSLNSFLKMDVVCNSYESGAMRERNSTWLVLNYFIGDSASFKFRALIEDANFSLSPYVGIAAPIGETLESGHVFCFLPLPREGSRQTGLPVHVNGFFALNQSRHHLRWATDEQSGHQISEQAIHWNERLVCEAVPQAYLIWLDYAVLYAEKNGNTNELIACVQNTIPNKLKVEVKWQIMLKSLFEDIKSKRILFSVTHFKWLQIKGVFVFSENAFKEVEYKTAILKFAKALKLDCAEVSTCIYEALTNETSFCTQILTPEVLACKMRKQNIHSSLATREMMFVLKFLLSCGNTKILESLQLLPLQSGKWAKFSSGCDPVFICTEEEINIFRGLEDRILRSKSELSVEFHRCYQGICNGGNFQLRNLRKSNIQKLLQMITQMHFTVSSGKLLMKGNLSLDWLKQVWHYLQDNDIISICQTVPLFPLMQDGNINHAEMIHINETVIFKQYNRDDLPEEVCICLRALGVKIVSSLPPWIQSSTIADYVKKPSRLTVTQVIECISRKQNNLPKHIEAFNCCETKQRTVFMLYLADNEHHSKDSISLLRKLKMFTERLSYTKVERFVSVEENGYYTTCKAFPVHYQRYLIDGYGNTTEHMLINLGCKEMKLHELFKETFQNINSYNFEDIKLVMDCFLSNFKILKRHLTGAEFNEVKHMASNIAFLASRSALKKPSELFSPSDMKINNLFLGQDVFPIFSSSQSTEQISILEELGLKVSRNVKASDLLDVAKMLEVWSQSSKETSEIRKKSKAFVIFLCENPSILEDACGLKPLKTLLKDIICIEYLPNPPDMFPRWMPWFPQRDVLCRPQDAKTLSMSYLVGSVMPLVDVKSARLAEIFGWNKPPQTSNVILQLITTVSNYKQGENTHLFILLEHLYERLNQCPSAELAELRDKNVVWNGNGFSNPDRCVLNRDNSDIELDPYFHFIPKEVQSYKFLFERIGCRKNQGVNELIETLQHISKINNSDFCYSLNLELALKIVGRLAERQSDIPGNIIDTILIPIRTDDDISLTLMPINACTYDDNPERYIRDEESVPVNFVHERISNKVAKALGIKSWLKTGLSETEELEVEEWGQEESLTDRIKGLLEGYRDGLSVPKELIQNADDADATVVKFLYDERENLDQRKSLLHSGMNSCQGPALWVFNDALFKEEDFKNIVKLNGATKQNKLNKIGKFGLGFCSVYNVTDVPSFVSGNNIVILDPHKSHLNDALPGNSPGLKIDLQRPRNRDLVRRNNDQFQPYNNIFGCDLLNCFFNGTLFRLPFRTSEQAIVSKISQTCYSDKEVKDLLQMLIKTAGSFLLFVQNVRTIEIYHLPRNATSTMDQKLVFSVSRRNERVIYSSADGLYDSLSLACSHHENIQIVQSYEISIQMSRQSRASLCSLDSYPENNSQHWLVSLATGRKNANLLKEKKHIQLSAVAVPCKEGTLDPVSLNSVSFGTYRDGHIFCYLPLPLRTGLSWHLHGCFETTSDRRHLPFFTEDDKQGRHSQWNDNLLSNTAVNAFINILLFLSKHVTSANYVYHQLWPLEVSEDMLIFKSSFYGRLFTENDKLFKGLNEWTFFKNVVFLHPDTRENTNIGDLAFQMINQFQSQLGKIAIDLPRNVYDEMKTYSIREVMLHTLSEVLIFDIFLTNINDSYWQNKTEKRNKLTLYALGMSNEDIESMVKVTKCIPCGLPPVLLQPCEVIHPNCELSAMFKSKDGRFPIPEFCAQDTFQRLAKMGMLTTKLPYDLLFDRCQSILNFGKHCCHCASDRIKSIIKYLSKTDVQIEFQNNPDVKKEIQMLHILPVLSCPRTWEFPWYSTTCDLVIETGNNVCEECTEKPAYCLKLGRPSDMFRQDFADMLGSVAVITDENWVDIHTIIKEKVLNSILEVKGRSNSNQVIKKVTDQMCIIADQYCKENHQYITTKDILDKLFDCLYVIITQCSQKEEYSPFLEVLKTKRIVFIGKDLIVPSKVAVNVKDECVPNLCKLPVGEQLKHERVYLEIGVRKSFDTVDIINEMRQMKIKWGIKPCNEIEKAIKLLINLADIMLKNQLDLKSIEQREEILAPDINGILRPTHELVVDDEEFVSTTTIHVVHDKIAPALAFNVGVKSKRSRCVHDISVGIPFGQKEELTTRLKGLLEAYPLGVGIMKELLQNADDAGATELHFVKDFRCHETSNILVNDKFQGPSLCVYNNSYFTEKDLQGIHDLGLGSKRKDVTKAGQYGVGFNAVYHLTDTPSFYSKSPNMPNGGILCVFDPTCCNIPNIKESEPGMMYYEKDIKKNFPNQLLGFSETELMNSQTETGTIFRFPFRTELSSLGSEICTPQFIEQLLSSFTEDIHKSMIFLKNVRKIVISDITSGLPNTEYSIKASLSEDDERKLKTFSTKFNSYRIQEMFHNIENTTSHHEVRYVLRIDDVKGKSNKWLVVQNIGLSEGAQFPENLSPYIRSGELCQMPIGGIAMPFDQLHRAFDVISKGGSLESETRSRKGFSGTAFTFLPLPGETGLPVHVNGHFVLDHEARHSLWKTGYRLQWNEFLIEQIIIPCMVSAITFVIKHFFHDQNPVFQNTTWKQVNYIIRIFHDMFPVTRNGQDSIWHHFVKAFYAYIQINESCVFPVIMQRSKAFSIKWVPLSSNCHKGAVFNVIQNNLNGYEKQQLFEFEKVFKQIGVNLIASPSAIMESARACQIKNILESNPDFVLKFLKTCDDNSDRMSDVSHVGTCIENTKFDTAKCLQLVVSYIIKNETFADRFDGLPIILTADSVLRLAKRNDKIYNTLYWPLLPKSSHMFLHESLLSLLLPTQFEKQFIFNLGLADFLSLMPQSIPENTLKCSKKVKWDKKRQDPLSAKWIAQFFEFLFYDSLEYTQTAQVPFCNTQKFKEKIDMFADWSFLPTIDNHAGEVFELTPLCRPCILFYDDLYNKKVNTIVRKFGLPMLDDSMFTNQSLKYMLQTMVAGSRRPYSILICLYENIYRLPQETVDEEDALTLMEFFNSALKKMYEENDTELKDKIKCLPFFVTHNGMRIDIKNKTNVFLFPEDMPVHGIETWANATGIIFLKDFDNLKAIFSLLGLNKTSVEDMYASIVLPYFNALPREHWLDHISYIKSNLLRTSFENKFSPVQLKIIHQLAKLDFIPVQNGYRRPDQLYDKEEPVFKCMIDQSYILPQEFYKEGWKEFLISLGLNYQVTYDLFIHFAWEVHTESQQNRSDGTLKKSKVLIQYFLKTLATNQWPKQSILEIKCIPFIEPYIVCKELSDIFRQVDEGKTMIAYEGSASFRFTNACWSTMNLLPYEAIPIAESSIQVLGIQTFPPEKCVIAHCLNICHSLEILLKNKTITFEKVFDLMKTIYDYLDKHLAEYVETAKERLKHTPFICIPNDNVLVKTSQIVSNLEPKNEIKPYLYKMPLELGTYWSLFKRLGASENVTCGHFVSVLKMLHRKTDCNELNPQELYITKLCIQQLEQNIPPHTEIEEGPLYLPNRNHILKCSTTLVISDNEILERRLTRGQLDLDFFIGHAFLEIPTLDQTRMARLLPAQMKPLLLTKIISEKIEIDNVYIHEECERALELNDFLHSKELIEGVIRLVLHKQSSHVEMEIEKIQHTLESITVRRVSGLNTLCYYNGTRIQGSSMKKTSHIKETKRDGDIAYEFYFDSDKEVHENLQELILNDDGVHDLIITSIAPLKLDHRLLIRILCLENDPTKIKDALDKSGVPIFSHNNMISVFPQPGTYVEERFHSFLEQGIVAFDRQEFRIIALELEDNPVDNNVESDNLASSNFIYVRIIDEVETCCSISNDLQRQYLVLTGGEHNVPVEIPIYRLYRFVRPETEAGTFLTVHDEQPNVSFTFDTNCKRIQETLEEAWKMPLEDRKTIVKRILLKWHPDKNMRNKEYCKHVFIFIRRILARLESGLNIDETLQTNVGDDASSNPDSPYYDICRNIDRQAKAHCKAYYEHLDEYNRFYRTGRYSDDNMQRSKVPDISKAKQWLRQAKNDYRVAELYFPDIDAVDGFNWICYTCHQACEKSLKAANFNIDRNSVPERTHSLTELAHNIGNADIYEQVRRLEQRLGEHTRMRYPESHQYQRIPSDIFTKDDAVLSLSTAKQIIDFADESIGYCRHGTIV